MIDPYSLKRPDSEEETRTFEENGTRFTLTLRKRNDFTRQMLGADKFSLYVKRYVTGEEVKGSDGIVRLEISTLRDADGMIPAMSERLCDLIATLETMQVAKPDQPLLDFNQWAAMGVVLPETMAQIQEWAISLTAKASDPKELAKNDSGEAAAP